MSEIDALVEYFKKFPGIGPRQARRFVYYLLRQEPKDIREFTRHIEELREHIRVCPVSYAYFYAHNNETLSPVERDISRNNTILMVVSNDTDMENIEKQRVYSGKYFILGGLTSPTDSNPEESIRAKELIGGMQKRIETGLEEIILATPLNRDGEHTLDYLIHLLRPLVEKHNIKITSLGRGMSTGTELEYVDEHTMRSALENRK
mgnify:CR=1 FL=1